MSDNIDKTEGNVERNSELSASQRAVLEANKFKPGQSGNPKGRPVGAKTGLRARLMQMLDQEAEPEILKVFEAKGIKLNDRDKAAVIAHVVGREALKGNMQAVKIITEQTEVPMPKELHHGGIGGGPITWNVHPVRPMEPKKEEDGSGS